MSFNVVYRGPLQRSRLSLLLDAASRAWGASARLVWLTPWRIDREQVGRLQGFLETMPAVSEWEILDGDPRAMVTSRRGLRRGVTDPRLPTLAVGFTSLPWATAAAGECLVWCVQGIPEERLLHRRGLRARAAVRASWALPRFLRRPQLTVTVSGRMANLITRRLPGRHTMAVPNACDPAAFAPPATPIDRRWLTYMGSGAPWQGVERLSAVWQALHRRDPGLRFRVVSRDERTRVLAQGIAGEAIEFRSAEAPRDVAAMLWEARCGFLLRGDDVVNRVSYPLKFGEYLAAGVPVVTTDIDWDPGDVLRDTGCGVALDPAGGSVEIADVVGSWLEDGATSAARATALAIDRLQRDRWVARLAEVMRSL